MMWAVNFGTVLRMYVLSLACVRVKWGDRIDSCVKQGWETGGSHPGGNHLNKRKEHLTRRRTQGAGIVKGWDDKRDRGRISDTFT